VEEERGESKSKYLVGTVVGLIIGLALWLFTWKMLILAA